MNHEEKIMMVVRGHSNNQEDYLSEWAYDSTFYEEGRKCEVCGHKIKNCVQIKNKINDKKIEVN